MDYIKKTILLTNDKKDICVLNIVSTRTGVFANFRDYSRFVGDMTLGILAAGKVYKQSVICGKSSGYDFKLAADFDLNSDIACVLINDTNAIVWGESGKTANYKSTILGYIESTQRAKATMVEAKKDVSLDSVKADVELVEDSTENTDTLFESVSMEEVEEAKEDIGEVNTELGIDNAVGERVSTSVDRNEVFAVRDSDEVKFLSKEELFDASDEEVDRQIDSLLATDDANFYEMIADQLDALFDAYPEESRLAAVVPNSRWVRVDYEGNGRVYVVGLIYELEVVRYVAYGVPAYAEDNVPDGLDGYSQWVPIDVTKPNGEGYFVMFQDAETGESIRLEDIT